jgi:hypothetical protein
MRTDRYVAEVDCASNTVRHVLRLLEPLVGFQERPVRRKSKDGSCDQSQRTPREEWYRFGSTKEIVDPFQVWKAQWTYAYDVLGVLVTENLSPQHGDIILLTGDKCALLRARLG